MEIIAEQTYDSSSITCWVAGRQGRFQQATSINAFHIAGQGSNKVKGFLQYNLRESRGVAHQFL